MAGIFRLISELVVFSLAVFAAANLLLRIASLRQGCNWIWMNLADATASFGWFLLVFFAAGVLAWPRISMLCRPTVLAACTVPAAESRPLTLRPYYVQRELAAWVWYYLKG